jgi:hypothetical protein
MNALKDSSIKVDNSVIRIIRPAVLIYDYRTYEYYATIFNAATGWKYGMQVEGYEFYWSLVKCDKFGNYLAVKEVGTGPVISLTIPQNHKYFRLLLTASNGKSVTTTISPLNTPLVQQPEVFN